VREWLDKGRLGAPTWPQAVLEWRGVEDFPPFEDSRRELRAPPERPLG
jgi:hypothetical protein